MERWSYPPVVVALFPACQTDSNMDAPDDVGADASDDDAGTDGDGGTDSADDGDSGNSDAEEGSESGSDPSEGGSNDDGDGSCFEATRLWFDDFENADYERWTGKSYDSDWGDNCDQNGFSTDYAVSGQYSHRSEITCAIGESHRGYGGIQFNGDTPLEQYTNTGQGIDTPYGVVNTYWSRLSTSYEFGSGKWFSFWTVNNACDWSDNVITLGLENSSNVLTPAHIINTGGTVTFVDGPPAFPLDTWTRTTIYINYHDGRMHIWQDGAEVLDATFSRSDNDMCQWHWGAYASGDNDDVVLYEDDLSLWKLHEPWTDFSAEPWFGETIDVCD